MLAVLETHPIQYHAPVYRAVQQRFGVPVTVVYGSDFSVAGYYDEEFGAAFSWDVDLLSGYSSVFLERRSAGGASSADQANPEGIRATLRRLKPSAILVTGYSPRFHRIAAYEAWRSGAPVLFRGEANDGASDRGFLKDRARSAALRLWYGRCRSLLYIGRNARDHYHRHGVGDDRLVFAPYCVSETPFQTDESARTALRATARQVLNVADDDFVVLFSGKLSARKGVRDLVSAIRALEPALRQRVTLVALGAGDLLPALVAAAAATPSIAFTSVGFQNQRELSPYYHAADLLVLPSLWSETWGLVVNEALQHGVPCVVSDRVGCAPDLIVPDVTGFVSESGSIESLAAAISRGLLLAGNRDVRDACRRQVAAYSVERAAEGIAAAYRGVVQAAVCPAQ